MSHGKGLVFAAALLVLAAFGIACGSSESRSAGPPPSPAAQDVSPTPEMSPAVPVLTPSADVLQFAGETMAFEYPDNWYILQRSYQADLPEERVVLANVERESAGAVPLQGTIRVEFSGKRGGEFRALPGEVLDRFDIGGVAFTLRGDSGHPLRLTGTFVIGGVNFRYIADAVVYLPEPPMAVLAPLLESWVAGATSNHPTRTCISPVECP